MVVRTPAEREVREMDYENRERLRGRWLRRLRVFTVRQCDEKDGE
jgi:hypothetical protein